MNDTKKINAKILKKRRAGGEQFKDFVISVKEGLITTLDNANESRSDQAIYDIPKPKGIQSMILRDAEIRLHYALIKHLVEHMKFNPESVKILYPNYYCNNCKFRVSSRNAIHHEPTDLEKMNLPDSIKKDVIYKCPKCNGFLIPNPDRRTRLVINFRTEKDSHELKEMEEYINQFAD